MRKLQDYVDRTRVGDGKTRPGPATKVAIPFVVGGLIIAFLAVGLALSWPNRSASKSRLADNTQSVSQNAPTVPSKGDDWLQPAERFDEYRSGDSHFAAQLALNQGDILSAIRLFGARNSIVTPDGPREQRMSAAIQKASDEQMGIDPGQVFADRVRKSWLPELKEIAGVSPSTTQIGRIVGVFEESERRLNDGTKLKLMGTQKAALDDYVEVLRLTQRSTFPRLRKAFVADLAGRMFRSDIAVQTNGRLDDQLVFTGYHFARNASIEDGFLSIQPMAVKLRFKTVGFRSSKLAPTSTYDLSTPPDDSLTPISN